MLNLSIIIYKNLKKWNNFLYILILGSESDEDIWIWLSIDDNFKVLHFFIMQPKKICHNLNIAQLFWLSEVQTKIDRYQALLDFHSCCCYTILTYFWFILQIGKAIYPSWEQEDVIRVVVLKVICDSKYDAKIGKGVSD